MHFIFSISEEGPFRLNSCFSVWFLTLNFSFFSPLFNSMIRYSFFFGGGGGGGGGCLSSFGNGVFSIQASS